MSRLADEKNEGVSSPGPIHPERETGVCRAFGGKTGDCQVPLMLHAFRAELIQPYTAEKIFLESPLPAWAQAVSDLVMEEQKVCPGGNRPSVPAGESGR